MSMWLPAHHQLDCSQLEANKMHFDSEIINNCLFASVENITLSFAFYITLLGFLDIYVQNRYI